MDKISTSRDLQASHGNTNERSLTKLPVRGSEPGDAQEQVGMPQAAKEIYRVPPALGDWWIINLLLNWFFFFFTATPRPSPDQPQRDSPERKASPQPTPRSGTTMYFGNGNTNSGNITGSYNTTNNSTTTNNNNNNAITNNAEKIYGGGTHNTISGTFN